MKTLVKITTIIALFGLIFTGCNSDADVPVPNGDCNPQPFSVTYAKYKSDRDNSYFIKGEVIEIVQHGNRIKIIEDFKGNYQGNSTITVWGAGRVSNRMDGLYNNHVTDTLLMLITRTDLAENTLCPQCKPYEQPNDYMTTGCSYSVLKLFNGKVKGKITDAYQETTLLWADFAKQFEITEDDKGNITYLLDTLQGEWSWIKTYIAKQGFINWHNL